MFLKPPVKTYVITSPLKGRLVNAGLPMANAKLIRSLEWNGDKEGSKEEEFITDENGYFSLPLLELDMAMRGLEQYVAKTKIYIINQAGERELIWYSPTMSPEIFAETGSELEELVCDITNPEVVTQNTSEKILTRCRWKAMPEFTEF